MDLGRLVLHDFGREDMSEMRLIEGKDQGQEALENNLPKIIVRMRPRFLWTLGQYHQWPFGAIAELMDVAEASSATKINISLSQTGPLSPQLSICDNGRGLSSAELRHMLSLGGPPVMDNAKDMFTFDKGFMPALMKLGKAALIFSKNDESRSIALLSHKFNEGKEDVEVPVVTYSTKSWSFYTEGNIQTEESANACMEAIVAFSPFDKVSIGHLFARALSKSGTMIVIWDMKTEESVSDLKWLDEKGEDSADIKIKSMRARPLHEEEEEEPNRQADLMDYSLRAYLEIFSLKPNLELSIGQSTVKRIDLRRSLEKTVIYQGIILNKALELTLGKSQQTKSCGICIYWHGRLIKAYKKVGNAMLRAYNCQGFIGLIDLTDVVDASCIYQDKQCFKESSLYGEVLEWMGRQVDNYRVTEMTDNIVHNWIRCSKCYKWRDLDEGFMPVSKWNCSKKPFLQSCEEPEQPAGHIIKTIEPVRAQVLMGRDLHRSGVLMANPVQLILVLMGRDRHRLGVLMASLSPKDGESQLTSTLQVNKTSICVQGLILGDFSMDCCIDFAQSEKLNIPLNPVAQVVGNFCRNIENFLASIL